jgi:hypothetical protein
MAEKHLKKPPPKYVYDIIFNTMAATGFPKGLYSNEESSPDFFDAVGSNFYILNYLVPCK